ncbi:MAG: hypothetical protein ABIP78_09500 [Pyrinomonadaceae bacterium]
MSIFFTACDVPDISEFTTQSVEMTRGIRQGVKDTGDVLKTAAANDGLFEPATIKGFQKYSKEYDTVMKPTLETLDSLDSYVEALNALARANKKSAENSKALVGAFNNLVSSASKLVIAPQAAAFEIPDMALKIGTGTIAAIENFRTAKSFKNRVNAAAEVVEGRYDKTEELVGGKKVVTYTKICTDGEKEGIEKIGKQYAKDLADKIKVFEEGDEYKELLEQYKSEKDPKKKEEQKKKIGSKEKSFRDSLKEFSDKTEKDVQNEINKHGCGVIDLLTFTMQDLRRINQDVSKLTEINFVSKNRTTFGLYQGIDTYYERVQNEIKHILRFKTLLKDIRELNVELSKAEAEAEPKAEQKEIDSLKKKILNLKNTVWRRLNDIYNLDGQAQTAILAKVTECDAPAKEGQSSATTCIGMTKYLTCPGCADDKIFDDLVKAIGPKEFSFGSGVIETALNNRALELFAENRGYLTEKERMQPDYERSNGELDKMRQNQKKLDKLLTSSIAALKTWSATHANLRETVNTKKPLSVAVLVAKVKDIWAVLEPAEAK